MPRWLATKSQVLDAIGFRIYFDPQVFLYSLPEVGSTSIGDTVDVEVVTVVSVIRSVHLELPTHLLLVVLEVSEDLDYVLVPVLLQCEFIHDTIVHLPVLSCLAC